VRVFRDGWRKPRGCTQGWIKIRALSAFENSPPVVSAERNQVHFFACILANIPHVELAGSTIERKPPGVAQSEGIDLIPACCHAKEGICRGRSIRELIDIDSENLPKQFVDILRAVAGIIAGSAVSHADVKITIRTERKHAAVVIGERLGDGEDHPLCGVSNVGIVLRHGVFGNDGRTVTRSCVVHEKTAIRCKLRMESQAQKSLLATANDAARDVQK